MPNGTAGKVLEALQIYKLKEEGRGKYRCNSPFRPGSNSHAISLQIADDEHGVYYDHVSKEAGSLYDLAKKLQIELPEKPALADTKRAYTGLEDYARAHGITEQTLINAGWKEVTRNNRPALEFPTETGKRWRFLDGKTPHYISSNGYERCWYGFGKQSKAIARFFRGEPLVICNGEISTIVGQTFGLAAIAMTGGEKTEIPLNLLAELQHYLDQQPDGQILVAMDCDLAGRKSAAGIAAQLKTLGYNARPVDMRLEEKGDLADFCMLYGLESFGALQKLPDVKPVQEFESKGHTTWTIIHSSDLKSLPTVEWIIPKEIQAMGINVIYGASGIGKSFLALDYALRIAQSQPVLYMAGEGVYGYEKRITAWEKHHKKTRGNLYMCTAAVSLLDMEDFRHFLNASKPVKPVLVIVDTLARSMAGGDENNANSMGLFIRACDEIKMTLGCAVLLVHHTGKNKDAERGSSALRGASDVMIKVSGESDLIIVESEKIKDDEPLPLRYFRLLPVSLENSQSSMVFIPSENVIQTKEDLLRQNQQKIMRLLADVFTEGASVVEIAEESRIGRGGVQRDMKTLRDLGFVSQAQPGAPYFITEEGKKALTKTLDTGKRDSHDSHDSHESAGHDEVYSEGAKSPDSRESSESLIHQQAFTDTGESYSHYKAGL